MLQVQALYNFVQFVLFKKKTLDSFQKFVSSLRFFVQFVQFVRSNKVSKVFEMLQVQALYNFVQFVLFKEKTLDSFQKAIT